MKIKFLLIILSVLPAFSACQKPGIEANQPVQTNKAANSAKNANSKARTFNGTGKVTKINLELVSVELDHEKIEGLMPEMIMEFYVTEKSELEKLKVGDEVSFVLEENMGQEKIISIEKIK